MSTAAEPSLGSHDPVGLKSHLADYCLWEEPERGIRIYLSLTTADRLQLEVLRGIDGFASDEAEVGGILIGRTEIDEGRAITLIEDFAPVPCRYGSGPFYRLSEEDAIRFEEELSQHSSDSRGLSVVGYYRSHNRDDLYLSSDDVQLIQKYFPEPDKVFLLVKTLPSRACTAGFFFWENGQIQTEITYLEVPLGPVKAFPKAEPTLQGTVRLDDRLTPAAKHLPKKLPVVQPARLFQSTPSLWRAWLLRGSALTVAAVVLLGAVNYWQSRLSRPQGAATPSLELHVQRQAGAFALTWNPNSRDLIGVEAASLFIKEGSSQRVIHLAASQLRSGTISFAPATDDVEIRFELERGGKPSAAEGIHLLLPEIHTGVSSIAGGGNSPGVAGKSDPESIVSSKKKTSPGVTPPPAASPLVARQTAGESGPPVTPKPFHFVAPVRSVQFSNTAPATNNVPLEQPPSIPMETTVSGLIVTTLRVPPPPPPSNLKQTKVELQPLAQAEAAPVLAQPQRATSYVGPKVIRPASPAIPFGFPYRITPDLELEVGVTIDENGKVTDAKLVSAKGAAARFMSASVLQAARLYLFEPAQDNNRKVASKLMLTFRFSTGPPK